MISDGSLALSPTDRGSDNQALSEDESVNNYIIVIGFDSNIPVGHLSNPL